MFLKCRTLSSHVFVLMLMALVVPHAFASDRESGHRAFVTSDAAEFYFPISRTKLYEWCPGGIAYSWTVTFRNKRKTFEFGFFLFTAMGASPCETGNLSEMLNAGQFSVFEGAGKSRAVVPHIRVEHHITPDGRALKIRISGSDNIGLMFSERPRTVIFSSIVGGKAAPKQKVPVTYR